MMSVRGVRGAVVVAEDRPEAVLAGTRELLEAILAANPTLAVKDLAGALFTVTHDLTSVHPARAARELGWVDVPLMCSLEIPVPGSLERCVRALLLWNTELSAQEIHHVYLGEAARLRPDLSNAFKG